MRSEIIYKLNSDEDYYYYLRENPLWHKILSIYKIDDINTLINFAEAFLKK